MTRPGADPHQPDQHADHQADRPTTPEPPAARHELEDATFSDAPSPELETGSAGRTINVRLSAGTPGLPRAVRQCRFPGCAQPAKPPNPRGGRPPAYCTDPNHNKASRFAVEHPEGAPGGRPPPTALDTDPARLGQDTAAMPPAPATTQVTESAVSSVPEQLEVALRRAERAEAIAEDRARAMADAENRAERREAQFVDRLMAASEEIATLRAELRLARSSLAPLPRAHG